MKECTPVSLKTDVSKDVEYINIIKEHSYTISSLPFRNLNITSVTKFLLKGASLG